jgi:hypothetical protein
VRAAAPVLERLADLREPLWEKWQVGLNRQIPPAAQESSNEALSWTPPAVVRYQATIEAFVKIGLILFFPVHEQLADLEWELEAAPEKEEARI